MLALIGKISVKITMIVTQFFMLNGTGSVITIGLVMVEGHGAVQVATQ